ncbi:tetratricopeptide repeat protein [Oceanobacillus halotolerans]|uniref:tetratricopeptide repeat protein n=1 Tax=Oceanobacillus halotolerans TaxID=2663380 RepID=UPI0013DB1068|nr:tetratricopeptide repeat protein [Oceanobacillus halotolerans]
MQDGGNNVILFPKWKSVLEDESLLALKEKRYEEALTKLNKLLHYQVHNHEIYVGKLICLMELNRYNEAEDLCETLMSYKDEYYYHYVHIYLTILFQTNQYELLMQEAGSALQSKSIPEEIRQQFQQLQDMSKHMWYDLKVEKTNDYIHALNEVVQKEDHPKQWRIIEDMRKMKGIPTKAVVSMLHNKKVHPVIKTAIFQWLQESNISEKVTIHKLSLHISVVPNKVTPIENHEVYKQFQFMIRELEQENPTLYQMVKQLTYRYCYVRYPILPDETEVITISEALKVVGNQYLNIDSNTEILNDKIHQYIEEIKVCEALYLSIIDES